MKLVDSTISGLTFSTLGMMFCKAAKSSSVNPGDQGRLLLSLLLLVLVASADSDSPSSSGMTDSTTMLFVPMSFMRSRMDCLAPVPMASMAITAATPNKIPSPVSKARRRFAMTASIASKKLKKVRCIETRGLA